MASFARAYGIHGTCSVRQVGGSGPRAVVIQAAVGQGGANQRADVRVIQDALNQVPVVNGGPEPPLNVDGLCWGKTLAAIRKFQKVACGFRWPDGRIEPEGRTHLKLRQFYKPPSAETVPQVYAHFPAALSWIYAARNALREAEFKLHGRPAPPRGTELTNKYFHLDKVSKRDALAAVGRIRGVYNTMETCIGRSTVMTMQGTGYFQEDPLENTCWAYTWPGGYTMPGPPSGGPPVTGATDPKPQPGVRKDAIYVCPRKLNMVLSEFYTVVVVHELAHFCGPIEGSPDAIVDHGYRRKPGFFQLSPRNAERTADCYAHFAAEAKLGREAPHG
jgi:hypothetical protein